ncbi:MAG: V-type ATPase subunit, partial [Ruminococcus sp.]|nr:V-type ATPase subunit [Ruminococcus sp.]
MQQDFTYAVARVRFRETKLLNGADLDSLLSAKETDAVMRILRDKGWGDNTDTSPDQLISIEEKKLWDFVDETVTDRSVLDFLRVPDDFHNIKAAVKCITRDIEPDGLFLYNTVCDPDKLYDCIKKREYGDL